MALPKLVALDLDGTVWYPDMYMLWGGGAPFKVQGDGTRCLKDRRGQNVDLMGIAGHIIYAVKHEKKWVENDTKLAWVSTCDEPRWADECLQKFKASPEGKAEPLVSLKQLADASHIYDAASKQYHFKQLQRDLGIPFEQMIFYDNQMNNIHAVSRLGVHCVYCPDGLTKHVWEDGLAEYAKKH